MATTVPQFPRKVIAGDTLSVTLKSTPYSNQSGYTLTVQLYGPSGNSPAPLEYATGGSPNYITVTSSQTFQLKVPANITGQYAPGTYNYSIIATDGTDYYTIESGKCEVEAQAGALDVTDTRSHNKKMLDAINATLENRATSDQQSYSIAGRSLTKIPISELLQLRDYYLEKANHETSPRRMKMVARMRGGV